MNHTHIERRDTWRALSRQDKQARLRELRRRHEEQVQLEMLRLRPQLR